MADSENNKKKSARVAVHQWPSDIKQQQPSSWNDRVYDSLEMCEMWDVSCVRMRIIQIVKFEHFSRVSCFFCLWLRNLQECNRRFRSENQLKFCRISVTELWTLNWIQDCIWYFQYCLWEWNLNWNWISPWLRIKPDKFIYAW